MAEDLRNNNSDLRATEAGWLSRERVVVLVLFAVTALALYLTYRIALPFLSPLAWALALAVLTHPLHRWLLRHIRWPNLTAGVSVALVAVAIVAPLLYLTYQIIHQALKGLEWLRSTDAVERWQAAVEGNPWLASIISWLTERVDLSGTLEQLSAAVAGVASAVLAGSAWAIVDLFITLFALFFLFRDRHLVLRAVRSLVPLSETETDEIFTRIAETIYGTLFGVFVVGLVQGVLGGLMFWILGLPAPTLWGAVMVVTAIVPLLGPSAIWLPAVVFLAVQGDWGKAVILTAWGAFIVGVVDNLLYPVLVGRRLQLHTLLVFIALVGGVMLFGSVGFVLGPIILAVTLALLDIWRRRTAASRIIETHVEV